MSDSHFASDLLVESVYSEKIIPQFDVSSEKIKWNGYSEIGLDSTCHFFYVDKSEYILVYEDYPLMSRDQITELVRQDEHLLPVKPKGSDDNDYIFNFYSDDPSLQKVGIIGSFRLFKIT